MKNILLVLLLISSVAHADEGASIVSTGSLPECLQTIEYQQLYPRWKVKNLCTYPVEILWCWKASPAAWKNGNNICPKTGFVSSGLIGNNADFEFPDRPYLSGKFKPSAMLTVQKVCKVTKPGQCERQP